MNIDTKNGGESTTNGGESTTTEMTNNGDLVIQTPLKKANPSKKTVSKKKASPSPTDITFKEYVKRGKKILISLQKQRRNFLNLYIDMVTDKDFTRNEKQFKRYMKDFSVSVGLSRSSHSKLLTIALNKGIVNNRENLPDSWANLYELRDFNNDQIVEFIEQNDGITQKSTLEDIRSVIKQDSNEKVTSLNPEPYPSEYYNIDVEYDVNEFDGDTEENVIIQFLKDVKRAEQGLLKIGLTAVGHLEIDRLSITEKKVA